MLSDKFLKFNSYLLLILPMALISGPFISDLIVFLSLISFFFYFKKKKLLNILYDKLFILFAILWTISVISSFFSTEIIFSLKSSLFYLRFLIFFLIIYAILLTNELILKKLLNILILIFFTLFLDSIFQKIYGVNIIGLKQFHEIRISSFFGSQLILGSYLVKFYPLLIGLLYLFYEKNFSLYFIILSFITLITVTLSAEKAALIIFFIEYFLILSFADIKKKTKYSFFIFPIILLSILLIILPNVKDRVYNQLISNSGNFKYVFTQTHHEHYLSAYKIFKDNKMIGIGPKMFRNYCGDEKYLISEYSCSTHPHNYSMQILSETGILGFFVFIYIYIFLIKDFFKFVLKNKHHRYVFPFYSVLILNLVNLMPLFPSGNFYNNWVAISYSIPIGIYFYFKSRLIV